MSETIFHSDPSKVRANGIEIEYDTAGEPSKPPLLLVSGLGGQMISWDEASCSMLAGRGYWVIRFDNRDVGLSTSLDLDSNDLPQSSYFNDSNDILKIARTSSGSWASAMDSSLSFTCGRCANCGAAKLRASSPTA